MLTTSMWHNGVSTLSNSKNVPADTFIHSIVGSSKLVQPKVIGVKIEVVESRYGRRLPRNDLAVYLVLCYGQHNLSRLTISFQLTPIRLP